MNELSKRSKTVLATCHPALQEIVNELLKHLDVTVLPDGGYRDKEKQAELVAKGMSRTLYPNSKHNHKPSLAVDIAPYPIDWANHSAFYFMAGHVFVIAKTLGYNIRWGGDWNSDKDLFNQKFYDLPHFELTGKEFNK